MDLENYFRKLGEWFLTSGLQIGLILSLMLVSIKVAQVLTQKLMNIYKHRWQDYELQKRADTLSALIRYTLNVVIFTVAALMILAQLGINIGPVLAGAGVVGLAIGFGAKKLVEDVISGFFIYLEDQIRVGDVVEIAGKSGLVEKVTLRMTTLRDLAGNVHFVRNGEINVVTNMTKEYSYYVFDIGVAYKEDIDQIIAVVKEVDTGLRKDARFKDNILEPIEILGLDKFEYFTMIIKARIKTKPIKQWEIAREFNKRLKKAFDEKNIEMSFPQQRIYISLDKKDFTPSSPVSTEHIQFISAKK